MRPAADVDTLLKARAEIDEQLRKHKNALTVLFTDVVGSTSFFERNGDTAGLVMIHRHDQLAARAIQQHAGKVVKTIGDSAMAEFPNPGSAVRAAVEIERQFLKLNLTLPEDQRVEVRIGVHTGLGFRKGNDLFGDVVNVAARIVKRTAPAQILISRAMHEEVSQESGLRCRWLNKITIDGRLEQEDIFEVVWTDPEAYRQVQERLAATSHIPPRYEALSQIGTGGTGIVYKVRDLETGEIVALKVLKPEIASDPDVQENFKRELCLARKITHKNVCRIHEFSRLNGNAYTSMEYVEGESLLSRLQRVGALPLKEALDIARQICAGLREAHAQGIVHRDLKPANIMLDRNGTVKIMDFGVARMVHRDGPMTGTIVGTPAYMSPEQAELKPVSACTDIYAVGLLLYEMLTGAAAFSGDTPVAVALKQIREYPKRPREILPEMTRSIDAVIMKCLQKDASKRYQSVDELEVALGKAARARIIQPWEVALNRGVARAELEIRNRLIPSVQNAMVVLKHNAAAFLKRQDWKALRKIQDEPVAMLGVAGLAGALTVFLFFGGWRPRTINAQTVQATNQNAQPHAAVAEGTSSEVNLRPSQYSLSPIASNQIDLYKDPTDSIAMLSSDPDPASPNLASPPSEPRARTSKPPRTAKAAEATARDHKRKVHVDADVISPLQAPERPVKPLALTGSSTSNSAPQIPVSTSSQSTPTAEPAIVRANTANLVKGEEANVPGLFLEVGSFKDETWANNAVDKLKQLGFHALVIHKNLLWTQSYHVHVGPFTDQADVAQARQKLGSQGYKARAVN